MFTVNFESCTDNGTLGAITSHQKRGLKISKNVHNEDGKVPSCGNRHELQKGSGKPAKRYRCKSCYENCVKNYSSEIARKTTKRVTTFCNDCPNKPYLCIQCFNKVHRFMNI